jgi:outer membrane beta-barrel protein
MKKILKGLLPGLLLVSLATPGFAENRQGTTNVSPFVGGYLLDHDQREENRPMFGLRAGYNFTEHWGAEGMFGYSLTETKQTLGSPRETDLYRYGADILYHFMPTKNLVPFIAIGGGGTNFVTPSTPGEESHQAGMLDYGVGLKYFVADNVALRSDVRHVLIINDVNPHNLEYSVGLTFQFGGKKKVVAANVEKAAAPEIADTTPPTVTFTAPVNGAMNVPVNQKAYVAFSEEMDPTTITGETFTVKQGKTPLSGKVTTSASSAIFTPAIVLEKGKTYTATITTGARDTEGNALERNYEWEFTAGIAADTTPPTVTFTSPVNGDMTAPVNQKAHVAFSENMDPQSITETTFTLKQGTSLVAGKVTASASTATFTPERNFEKGKSYTGTVTTGARDLSGNSMTSDYVWNFTAFSAPKVVGVLTTLENSHFDFNSVEINENGKTILNHNITLLKKDPNIKLRIAGYTSAAGTTDYNQKLSERRAASVKDYLVKIGGIDERRLTTIGYGEANPAKYEANPSDKLSEAALANMRVVVEIIED